MSGWFGPVVAIQGEGARAYDFWAGLKSHIAQPEGFLIVGGWLIGTWMFDILPNSYFSFEGGIQWPLVFAGLLIQVPPQSSNVLRDPRRTNSCSRLQFSAPVAVHSSCKYHVNNSPTAWSVSFLEGSSGDLLLPLH